MNVYGAVFPTGFVTSVCTYPEYTGHGIMKRLMLQSLTNMRGKGQSLALLYPYSIPLYHRLGWEIVSNKISYTIKDRQIPDKASAPGYVRRVKWENTDFKNLHSDVCRCDARVSVQKLARVGGVLALGRGRHERRGILLGA